MTDALRLVVKKVVDLLVAQRYDELESLTGGVRLSAAEMATAVEEYGRHLVQPPEEGYRLMVPVRVIVAEDETWSVWMPLWTAEEGRSDLCIELTVIFRDGREAIELDNILVS